jgi:hypothetical protein
MAEGSCTPAVQKSSEIANRISCEKERGESLQPMFQGSLLAPFPLDKERYFRYGHPPCCEDHFAAPYWRCAKKAISPTDSDILFATTVAIALGTLFLEDAARSWAFGFAAVSLRTINADTHG